MLCFELVPQSRVDVKQTAHARNGLVPDIVRGVRNRVHDTSSKFRQSNEHLLVVVGQGRIDLRKVKLVVVIEEAPGDLSDDHRVRLDLVQNDTAHGDAVNHLEQLEMDQSQLLLCAREGDG